MEEISRKAVMLTPHLPHTVDIRTTDWGLLMVYELLLCCEHRRLRPIVKRLF